MASDGFTYERSSIETWFQLRRSSPSTGLEISNTTVKRNANLAQGLNKWISGEDFLKADGGPGRARKNRIYVNFSSPPMHFNRSIPRDIPVSSLYKLAFQGMRGRYSEFDLRFNGSIIGISGNSGLPRGVANGSTIDINIHKTSSYSATMGTADQSEFEEISLVKVYWQPNNALFAYWIPRSSTNSLASIVFRHWRYRAESSRLSDALDLVVWTDMENMGDGERAGRPRNHWKSIAKYLTPTHAAGNLGEETVFSREVGFKGLETVPSLESSQQPLVFKVELGLWRSGGLKGQKKKSDSLSRVIGS